MWNKSFDKLKSNNFKELMVVVTVSVQVACLIKYIVPKEHQLALCISKQELIERVMSLLNSTFNEFILDLKYIEDPILTLKC